MTLLEQRGRKKLEAGMRELRTAVCKAGAVAEELVPLGSIEGFYRRHLAHAYLPHGYSSARVLHETLSWEAVAAYRSTLAGEELGENPAYLFRSRAYGDGWRAEAVAKASGMILWPRACADAALVAAYATLKCREAFDRQRGMRAC